MRQKGQNLNLANSSQQWAKDARNQYSNSRMAQAARSIRYKGADNIDAYAAALDDIGAAGGNDYIASGPGAADDLRLTGRQLREMEERKRREEEADELELEASRLKLAQARRAMMDR